MNVHCYTTTGGKDLIKDYISHLSNAERVDGMSVLQSMKEGRMDKLTIKPWQGKVWEVHFHKHNRIFYVAIGGNDIYLLHACRKQKNKTTKTDAQIVRIRAKELDALVQENFI